MKSHLHFRHLTPVLAILLMASMSAFAKNSRDLKLVTPALLGGTQLAAGEYKVSWESHSPDATVTFTKGKNVVVTAHGKWVERDTPYNKNSVVYETNSDGSRTIIEIRFAGMKQAIVFGEPTSTTQG